ncbi:TetR family transcriptional regulator [Agromyces mediolanus]|uniref:TetR family transcriptional regulator n=1 Tax=Agromyces mediolanus TaxID=41986 RepID=UPI00383618E4
MSYLPRDERRTELLHAAVRVLERDGLAAVTSRAVATEAGVSPGLVHHRFTSTSELAAEAWRAYVDRERAAYEHETPTPGRASVDAFFAPFAAGDRTELARWADAWRHAQSDALFAGAFAESYRGLERSLAARIPGTGDRTAAASRLLLIAFGLAGAQRIDPDLVPGPAARMSAAIDRELAAP